MTTKTTTRTARAPYQVGDHVSALFNDPTTGATCLARAARVVAVVYTNERADYPWTITYRIGNDLTREVRVNAAGVDVNRYVEPSTSVLTIEETHSDAGQIATALAATLRRARVAGPLATTTGGNNVAVVLTWSSGNDRIVVGVEVWDGAPVLHVAAYEDREHDTPAHEHTARSIPAAVTEVVRLLVTYRQNTGQECSGEPPFDVVGDHVSVRTAGVAFLTGTVTDSGPWGIEVETLPGGDRQTLAWTGPGRTFLFQQHA